MADRHIPAPHAADQPAGQPARSALLILTHLALDNWLAHPYRSLELRPLTLICGPNGSGKTSVRDALRYVLLGELPRQTTKATRASLANDASGRTTGGVTLSTLCDEGPGTLSRDLLGRLFQSGAPLNRDGVIAGAALDLVLDPMGFAAIDSDARRTLLLAVLRVEIGPEAVLAALTQRVDPAVVAQLPKTGTLTTWRAQAETEAQQARGAWKQITGESYGSKKAETWQRTAPAIRTDAADLVVRHRTAQENVLALAREMGAVEARAADAQRTAPEHAELVARIGLLDGQRAARAALADQIIVAERHLATATAARAALATCTAAPNQPCPACQVALTITEAGHLACAAEGGGLAMAAEVEAAAERRVTDAQAALLRLTVAVIKLAALVLGGQAAVDTLARSKAADSATASRDQPELAVALVRARGLVDTLATELRDLDAASVVQIEAIRATAQAAAAQARAVAWVAIAGHLAPDGIPGELLASALDVFNDAVEEATPQGWRTAYISPSCQILASNRDYRLLSESEQWRVCAVIGMAIARLSGLRLVVLDRMDMLEPSLRGPALAWVLQQLDAGVIDICICMITLKDDQPAGRVPHIISHWLGSQPTAEPMARAASAAVGRGRQTPIVP